MKPETLFQAEATQEPSLRSSFVALALVAGIIVATFWPTIWSMVSIWARSDTFAHGFLVLPVFIWLVWHERKSLIGTSARPTLIPIGAIAAAGFLWLTARLSAVLAVEQFAAILMIQAAAVTMLGWNLSKRLAVPLLFLFFAVPFGEILLPTLIDWTADATVSLLRLSGVPVFREGNHFQLPSGRWSVVEACSGLRYLIASMFGGTVYAYLRYRSTSRRVTFIVASILVPIVANWLRAYGIVMLAHYTDNKLGVSVDHIIYGWFFFGLVMLLLFWLGSFWAEDPEFHPTLEKGGPVIPTTPRKRMSLWRAGAVCIAAIAIWPLVFHVLDSRDASVTADLPTIGGTNGWSASGDIGVWTPKFVGTSDELRQRFTRNGQWVDVYIAYYRDQQQGSELIGAKNQLVYPGDVTWKKADYGSRSVSWAGEMVTAQQATIVSTANKLEVLELYWIDGTYTGSEYMAKILLALARLRGRGDDSAAVVISADNSQVTSTAAVLEKFAADMGQSISNSLEQARNKR